MKGDKINIATGKMLGEFLKENRISRAEFGRYIGRSGISVTNYLRNETIQTNLLMNICHATRHNFFQDIANLLPRDFGVSNALVSDVEKEQLIAQLQEENKILKIQNELLMKLKV